MKPIYKILSTIFLLLAIGPLCHAQYASRIYPRPAAPASCSPGNGDVYYDTATNAVRQCIAANTWQDLGLSGNSLTVAQGTLTASNPVISTTATWNNAAVTFTEWFANVTDTASAAGSLLVDLQVGGVSQFNVTKAGAVTSTGGITSGSSVTAGAAAFLRFTGSTRISAPADSQLSLQDNAAATFDRLILGPASVAGTGIINTIVGGQTQGVIIGNGDGSTVSFAELAAAANGCMIYCDDCTKATPCAGGGNGALAKRLNGAWDCD